MPALGEGRILFVDVWEAGVVVDHIGEDGDLRVRR